MADPLSVTAGVIQVVGFALGGVNVLLETIQRFKSSSKTIENISKELEALSALLKSLEKVVEEPDTELPLLQLPLKQCGTVCRDFQKLVSKIAPGNDKDPQKFRVFLRLQSHGQDIRSFQESLELWKTTIFIALGDANLRYHIVTKNVLKEYKEMIASTTSRLEMRLESLDDSLDSLSPPQSRSSNGAAERIPLQQERESTSKCLEICAEVMVHIADAQQNLLKNISTPSDTIQAPVTTLIGLISAPRATNEALRVCENTLSRTSSRLQRQLQDVDGDLQALPPESEGASSDTESKKGSLEAEVESTKSAIAVMTSASETANGNRINVYEDVSMAEDGNQYIVSTIGDLISAKRVTAGARSAQVLGQLSEANFDRAIQTLTQRSVGRGPEAEPGAAERPFDGRYGTGYKMNPQDPTGTGAIRPKTTKQ